MAGTPSTTVPSQGAGVQAPGYGFSRDFFNSLMGVSQNPFPVYQGQIDPGLSPTLQNIIQQAQGMSQQGAPSIFQGIQGSLGSFLNPQFQNPNLRIPQGYSDYFNMNPQQQLFGGGQLGAQGFSGPVGMPGPAGPSMDPNQPFSNVSNMGSSNGQPSTGNAPSAWGSSPVDMSGRAPLTPSVGSSGAAGGEGNMGAPHIDPTTGTMASQASAATAPQGAWPSGYTPPAPGSAPTSWDGSGPGGWTAADGAAYTKSLLGAYAPGGSAGFGTGGGNAVLDKYGLADPTQASGVQTAWNMGAGANRGQTRIDPATGQAQIMMGTGGGGESYSWQPFDPSNYGMVQNAEMYQRYGNNWTSGGAAGQYAGHTALQPGQNQQQTYDAYYSAH